MNMGKLKKLLKERNPQACLTKGYYDGFNTRWRGLESYLLRGSKGSIQPRRVSLVYC